jgi:hypothetical protein
MSKKVVNIQDFITKKIDSNLRSTTIEEFSVDCNKHLPDKPKRSKVVSEFTNEEIDLFKTNVRLKILADNIKQTAKERFEQELRQKYIDNIPVPEEDRLFELSKNLTEDELSDYHNNLLDSAIIEVFLKYSYTRRLHKTLGKDFTDLHHVKNFEIVVFKRPSNPLEDILNSIT